MSKTISGHEFGGVGELLSIQTLDEPGHGGAHHEYLIGVPTRPDSLCEADDIAELGRISFQNEPVGEAGVNGVTEGALLAIVADRLRDLQNGPFACRTNALALTKIEEALHWLEARTKERISRGVEGTSQK